MTLQQDAVVAEDMSFKPITGHNSLDEVLLEPDNQQRSWLWNMMSNMGKHIQSLPSSREAPEHLARYQSMVIDDNSAIRGGATTNGAAQHTQADPQHLDPLVLKHLQELQRLGSAPVRDVKTDVSDPDQQWFLLDNLEDRAGPNALRTEGLPDGGVVEVTTNEQGLWRTSTQEEELLDLNKLPRSSHHVCCCVVMHIGTCIPTMSFTVCGVE